MDRHFLVFLSFRRGQQGHQASFHNSRKKQVEIEEFDRTIGEEVVPVKAEQGRVQPSRAGIRDARQTAVKRSP